MPGQRRVGQQHLGDGAAVPGEQVDHTRREPGLFQQLQVSTAARVWVGEGFQITVLPIRAGAVGRFPAIAVKLNGVTA